MESSPLYGFSAQWIQGRRTARTPRTLSSGNNARRRSPGSDPRGGDARENGENADYESFAAAAPAREQDPASPHLALLVVDVLEAKAELDHRGRSYLSANRGAARPRYNCSCATLRQNDRVESSRPVLLLRH
jgi:hypothetical protein